MVTMVTGAPQLLPAGAMAQRLRVTTGWLRDEADAGRLPCLRAGDRYLFHPETIEQMLVERARQGLAVTAAEGGEHG